MIGSRKRPRASITSIKRLTWAGDGSRWNGVGSTRSIGSAASSTGVPPNGSRYDARTSPSSAATCSASSAVSGLSERRVSLDARPTDLGAVFLRLRIVRFLAMLLLAIQNARTREPAAAQRDARSIRGWFADPVRIPTRARFPVVSQRAFEAANGSAGSADPRSCTTPWTITKERSWLRQRRSH